MDGDQELRRIKSVGDVCVNCESGVGRSSEKDNPKIRRRLKPTCTVNQVRRNSDEDNLKVRIEVRIEVHIEGV